jgi:hypothetical protein
MCKTGGRSGWPPCDGCQLATPVGARRPAPPARPSERVGRTASARSRSRSRPRSSQLVARPNCGYGRSAGGGEASTSRSCGSSCDEPRANPIINVLNAAHVHGSREGCEPWTSVCREGLQKLSGLATAPPRWSPGRPANRTLTRKLYLRKLQWRSAYRHNGERDLVNAGQPSPSGAAGHNCW